MAPELRARLVAAIEDHRHGRLAEAMHIYRDVLDRVPDHFDTLRLYGAAQLAAGAPEAALPLLQRALRRRSNLAEAWALQAEALAALRRPEEAVRSYEHALLLAPGDARARYNLGLQQLLLGRYAEGWANYEWRQRVKELDIPLVPGVEPWDGRSPLAGRTLLLAAEQGYGDTLQFCRFAPELARRGARVLLWAPAPLTGLLSSLAGVERVLAVGEPIPAFDLHCRLPGLPARLGTTLATLPAAVPYLAPSAARLASWRRRLGPARALRIGLACSGNPGQAVNAARSVPLADFAPLALAGAELHLLQKDLLERDAGALRELGVFDHRAGLGDFEDTAALACCMDAVVSVCTSVAHLAGALGLPLHVLLGASSDWRWLLDRDDSPWYPTARLFRRSPDEGWGAVVARSAARIVDDSGRGWALRGDALGRQAQPHDAIAAFERALALEGPKPDVLNLLSVQLDRVGRDDESLGALEQARAVAPGDLRTRYNLGLHHLMHGRLEQGWDGYALRHRFSGAAPAAALPGREWAPGEDLPARVLVVADEGLGDTILFCRFAAALSRRGARVVLGVQPELRELLRPLAGVEQLISDGDPLPAFDRHVRLLDVPARIGVSMASLDAPDAPLPYLRAGADRVARWKARLGAAGRPRIGIACSGNPLHPEDRRRSIALERFGALAALDVQWHLLQKDLRESDRPALDALGVADHRDALSDLADAAALAGCMDAVVSVDTAMAHLAGALGIELHLLLPHPCDWRWFTGRADSPWYPSARLYRQRTAGDWSEPLERLAAALVSRFRSQRSETNRCETGNK